MNIPDFKLTFNKLSIFYITKSYVRLKQGQPNVKESPSTKLRRSCAA